ncbi:ISPsy2, transposase truncated [Stutzerimonas stutzeri]|nr:ISPsy2, transposase truncated [Stutzerimonas stutzeri]
MKQMTFADAEYAGKRKQTRKELFLIEMDQVVPWKGLIALIEPHYPKGEGGRPAYPLMAMLRIHLMQNWFGYSDPAMEEALYETTILRQFAGLSLERIPDETTILNFRRLLEKHELAAGILGVINGYLGDRGLSLRQGTIVDATLIHAPSSTKNQDGKRDPEMHQSKKGNQYYFGMKAHIGVRIPRHSDTQPTLIRTPVPRSFGQAVGAQRRRGGIVSPGWLASSISASVCALIHPSD